MTKLLEKAFQKASSLPAHEQDEVADWLLQELEVGGSGGGSSFQARRMPSVSLPPRRSRSIVRARRRASTTAADHHGITDNQSASGTAWHPCQ